jgi:hypothetical protein
LKARKIGISRVKSKVFFKSHPERFERGLEARLG